jgi:molybdenum cofactor biosynthesis enzyme MoaA
MKIQTFTIVVGTNACNAHCPYCISKMTFNQGVTCKNELFNWINFDKACFLAQINHVSTVLLTGKGEPTLYPNQITEFLKRMKKFNFPLIELQTNGLVFERNWEKYEPYLNEWRELGLNTIAFSIVHPEKERNKEIYSPNEEHFEIKKIVDKLHKIGFSIRLSCIMIKGYVDSVESVVNLINKSNEWGVEQLTIRSVVTPEKSEDLEVYTWTKEHIINKERIFDISEFLDKKGHKLMTLDHGGVVYDFNGQNICLTDCLTLKPNSEDLRQLIFFPDGHLRYDWQYKGAILL